MTMADNDNDEDVTPADIEQYNAIVAAMMDLTDQVEQHGVPASICGAAVLMFAGKFCAATGWSFENFSNAAQLAFESYVPSKEEVQ